MCRLFLKDGKKTLKVVWKIGFYETKWVWGKMVYNCSKKTKKLKYSYRYFAFCTI